MEHLILLLYLACIISGIFWLNNINSRIKATDSAIIKTYRNIFLNYTVLLFCTSIVVYILINLNQSEKMMQILAATVLIISSPMVYLQADFQYRQINKQFPLINKRIALIPIAFSPVSAIIIFFSTNFVLIMTVIGFQIGCILITPVLLFFTLKSHKDSIKKERWWQILEMSIAIGLTFFDILFRYEEILKSGILISLPLVYLLLNLLHFIKPKKWLKGIDLHNKNLQASLTPKEKEIVKAISLGHSNKEIAYKMQISTSTVKNHIYNIYQKTGAQSRVDLLNKVK